MNLSEAITHANKQGYAINNLYQIWQRDVDPDKWPWSCSLYNLDKLYEFGRGSTPEEAILAALHKVEYGSSEKFHFPTYTADTEEEKKRADDLMADFFGSD